MKAENWKNVKDVLLDILSLDAAERRSYLESANVSVETLEEVESLLAFEEESEDSMRLSAVEFSKDFLGAEDENKVPFGQRVGVYEIIGELGQGGMGAVYLAKRSDGKFEQKVALKLLKREMNTATLRQRFQQEREILASLQHPNIARLLDAGTTADQIPFIAMEYVEGLPIDDYCAAHDLELTERLNLFCTICATVNYAHRNLIVHRDLKPSNILVTTDGSPKLLDFGISKILSTNIENVNAATITKLGVMTPGYASPEQLRGESVTTATDVYSLGVILYELLSGHRPFGNKESNLKEIYKAVIDDAPPPPSTAIWDLGFGIADSESKTEPMSNRTKKQVKRTNPKSQIPNPKSLTGDLDNIVLKALKKEPERRYSSAENFAEDIRRHLDGLPVLARPDTFAYRTEKFIRRNLVSVVAGILILLAIIGGAIATLWQANIARTERARAEKRFNDVRKLANSFLFEFSPKIENIPGTTPARQLLVTRALEYLDNLAQESGDDLELQRELAKAYEKVGDVQGNPYNPNIGDVKGALQSYDKAQIIRQTLLEKEPENLEAQSDLANNFEIHGDIQSNGGDYAQSKDNYDKALDLREKIVARQPQNYEARVKLASAVKSRGLIPFYEGDNKKALEFFNRASQLYEQLHLENPSDEKVASQYFYSLVTIGETQGWDDQPEIGAENIRKGLDLLIPLSAKYPNNHDIQRTLMLAYSKAGENYEDLEQFDKSIAAYNQDLAVAESLYKADSQNVQAKRDVALAIKNSRRLSIRAEKAANRWQSCKPRSTSSAKSLPLIRITPKLNTMSSTRAFRLAKRC